MMMRVRIVGAGAVLVGIGLLCAPAARADELTATLGQPLREVSHAVQLKIVGGVAVFTVRRSFANGGAKHEEAALEIDLPQRAAATGLRIRAARRWFRGELMKSERAGRLYEKLTGIGPHAPRDPALLQWVEPGKLQLRVFPVPPRKTATVEYTLVAPARYVDGRYVVAYPGAGDELASPVLRVRPPRPRATIEVEGRLAARGQPVVLAPGPDEEAEIAIAPPRIRTLSARLGRAVASRHKQFLWLSVAVAPRLRRLPRRLSVVFVVDASHSVGGGGVARQLAVARSYLRHVPHAKAEVVAYRRRGRRLFEKFVNASAFAAQLAAARRRGALATGNGSALDEGLRHAAAALRRRRGTRRVVILGDGLLRPAWRNRLATRRLAAVRGAVTHVVLPTAAESDATEERDDSHALAPIAAARGGVLLHVGVPSRPGRDLDRITLGLVRPIRIDAFRVVGKRLSSALGLPDALGEGQGVQQLVQLRRAPRRIVLRGKIWAARWRRAVRVTPSAARAAAAFVFGLDRHNGLSRREMARVARRGRAVSPVTSYLAIEPGVRPSKAGIIRSRGVIGVGGLAARGCGYGSGRSRQRPRRLDLAALMKRGVARCRARHRPKAAQSVTLVVDTTYDEIVDVAWRRRRGSPAALARCLVEEAWRVKLPARFDRRRARHTVTLRF